MSAFLSVTLISVCVSGSLSNPVNVIRFVPRGHVHDLAILMTSLASGLSCKFMALADD